jgi:O-antigen ligase
MTELAEFRAKTRLFAERFPLFLILSMAFGLALFAWGGALPLRAAGLALFGGLALLRPDLAVPFVPLAVSLYLIPVPLTGAVALPVAEAALWAVAGAVGARWAWQQAVGRKGAAPVDGGRWTVDGARSSAARRLSFAVAYGPPLLLLAAGALGVALAITRGPALREFRWMIVEPLLFYALLRAMGERAWRGRWSIITGFLLGGAAAAALGLLQYAGLDLVPLLGEKRCFCENIVTDGGARRVASVYGHPNNLGLYLGRVWPLAAALALAKFSVQDAALGDRSSASVVRHPPSDTRPSPVVLRRWCAVVALLCLGGIAVSFSRGALLGAGAALLVLALRAVLSPSQRHGEPSGASDAIGLLRPLRIGGQARRAVRLALLAVGVVGLTAGLTLALRGDVTAGSTPVRLLLWREALGYIRLHPLGIGLDQFLYYHDPNSGRSLIDPALLGTSEVYAAHPHNLLLDLWLRVGPLGLVAFGWALARFTRRGLVAWRAGGTDGALALGALAAMAAALVHGLVDQFYFVPDLALAFWLLVGLADGVWAARRPPQ